MVHDFIHGQEPSLLSRVTFKLKIRSRGYDLTIFNQDPRNKKIKSREKKNHSITLHVKSI